MGVEPSEGGRGICVAERAGIWIGIGRPNAPPKGVGWPPVMLPPKGDDLVVFVAGVGRDDAWRGLLSASDDLRYVSVMSSRSEVSS